MIVLILWTAPGSQRAQSAPCLICLQLRNVVRNNWIEACVHRWIYVDLPSYFPQTCEWILNLSMGTDDCDASISRTRRGHFGPLTAANIQLLGSVPSSRSNSDGWLEDLLLKRLSKSFSTSPQALSAECRCQRHLNQHKLLS